MVVHLGMISRERLKIEVKLPLSANRKSMLCRLAQQRVTLSDIEWPFHALCTILKLARFENGHPEFGVIFDDFTT